jgi:hypothetical protein
MPRWRLLVEVSASQRAGTLRLTLAAMGLVLGISAALVLPLLLPWRGVLTLVALAASCALAPFLGPVLVSRLRRRPDLSRLVSWRLAGAVTLISGLTVLPMFNLYRGVVRVLNHGEEPFAVWIDGRRLARVEPSSGESALAGVELIVPAGRRNLRVTAESDGRELFVSRQLVTGGSPHLFAPESAGYCFSIERRGYGDAVDAPFESEPLSGSNPFWVLPDGIAWFTPNPEPGPFMTSGGTLSCLRQKRCPK